MGLHADVGDIEAVGVVFFVYPEIDYYKIDLCACGMSCQSDGCDFVYRRC